MKSNVPGPAAADESDDAVAASDGKHGVQSFEVGVQVLQAILGGHRGMMLKEIGVAARMSPSKVHRYLVSMVRTGLVEQERASGRYDLGPLALHIGLVASDRLDRIQAGLEVIAALRDEINEVTALAAWSDNGPIVLRWERPQRPISVSVVTGSALRLLTTAVGRVFAAHLPPARTGELLRRELEGATLPRELRSQAAVEKVLQQTRARGLAVVERNHLAAGVVSLGVPVFDARSEVTLAIGVVGIQGMLDIRVEGSVAQAAKAAARRLSKRLGHRGDATT